MNQKSVLNKTNDGLLIGRPIYEIDKAVSWQHITAAMQCFPEYKTNALLWMKDCLGYLPQEHIYLPYLSFMQAVIGSYKKNIISFDNYIEELLFHIANIRNDDMKKGGWLASIPFDQSDYDFYETHLGLYKNVARERLCEQLGYEPSLEYSLEAEIHLRQVFEIDHFNSELLFQEIDYKAATIVRYRETFIFEGEAAADEIELLGLRHSEIKRCEKELV